jgi:predicted DNA-binding transcriptional regulator YafY
MRTIPVLIPRYPANVTVSGASRPATRLLTMLEVLEARGTVSGRELAERLEVDPRTVRRYAVKLEELGIPVETERGPYGGYRLRPGFKLPPLMLTDDEATAVVLGLIVSRRTGIQIAESAVEEELAKILRVLPTELRDRVGALEGSLDWTWTRRERQPPATEVVLTLAAAIRSKRRARIRYATPGREEADRIVAPYGLVFHAGKWYLAADDERSGEIRTFRVDRVRSAELRSERATPPEASTPSSMSSARSRRRRGDGGSRSCSTPRWRRRGAGSRGGWASQSRSRRACSYERRPTISTRRPGCSRRSAGRSRFASLPSCAIL